MALSLGSALIDLHLSGTHTQGQGSSWASRQPLIMEGWKDECVRRAVCYTNAFSIKECQSEPSDPETAA